MENLNTADPIKIVIGSWGSYNERNERALGSSWLTLNDYDSWEEIEEELKKQGFELDGIDEWLFIQDIDAWVDIPVTDLHPQHLFELLYESEVLSSQYLLEVMDAFIQVRSFTEWSKRVEEHGSDWSCGINLYSGDSWADYGYELAAEWYDHHTLDAMYNYIDWDEYGKDMGDDLAYQFDNGIIEIQY